MKRRTAVLATILAVTLSVLGFSPAQAVVPDAPVVTALDSSTPGHVTGTVTSDQPFVLVRLASNVPGTLVTLVDGSGTFDLETWGYGPTAAVEAAACTTETPDPDGSDCSAATTAAFTPTDVIPEVTWPTDDTIGPGQTASVTVSDPAGGGTLKAVFAHDDGGTNLATTLDRNGTTDLNLNDGAGSVVVTRCATANPLNCTAFSTPQTFAIERRTIVTAAVSSGNAITQADSTSVRTVDTDRTGTYELSWHLEDQDAPGVPVDGFGSTDPIPGILDSNGTAEPFTIDGTGLPDGEYDVVATITVDDTYFDQFPASPAIPAFLLADTTGPGVVSATSSPTTIYPLVASTKYPTLTSFNLFGDAVGAVSTEIRNSLGQHVANPTAIVVGINNQWRADWNGRLIGGDVAPAGVYTLVALDALGNESSVTGHVSVSGKKMILKTLRRTTTPRATKVDQYVGRCSTLRRPSLRGWVGSFGYYANTKCARQTFRASGVSTAHAVFLPKAERYVDIRVEAYGGAARSKPSSRAVIRYLNTGGNWVNEKTVSRTLGTHRGVTRSTTGVVFGDRSFAWGFLTGFGNRYDVKNFTLVLRYYVLG